MKLRRCSKCQALHSRNHCYCADCHAEYMRDWRARHDEPAPQWKRHNARTYAGVYLKRGRLEQQPCERCGGEAQMHHEDYDRPLDITWLCRPCHLALHAATA